MLKLFWLFLSIFCIGWYIAVLGYVALKGGSEIKEMLKQLSADKPDDGIE